MKYYNKKGNEFIGFYDAEANKEMLFDISYNEEKREVEEVTFGEDGKQHKEVKTEIVQVPVYTLKEGFFEISEEKWKALLDGQSEGKEIRILKDGTLGLYEKPVYTGTDLVKPVWNEELEEWEEGATSEEILIERKNILLQAKAIKQEIKDLEEIAEWGLDEDLDSVDTIKMLQEKFDELIGKVKELTKIYKKLKNQETQAI